MGNIHADIKPGGLNQREEIQLLAMLTYSLEGLCQQLDDDTGSAVALDTYEANCYIAMINTIIEDCVGNRRGQYRAEHLFYEMGPGGITNAARLEWLYNYFNAIETLTEQLNGDNFTLNTYESLIYTAYFLGVIKNQDGNSLGNGTTFYFRPGGFNDREYIELLYNMVKAWQILCAMLTTDTNADNTYTTLWYTATILLRVENAAGDVIGNDRTDI